MTIDEICNACICAIKDVGYNDSTIYNYEGIIRRFKQFCAERGITDYSSEIGEAYANDVISLKTGKFSLNRYHQQGRFFRLIDSYYINGEFDFAIKKRGKIQPNNPEHLQIYHEYQRYLCDTYENENTIHFYEYGMYSLLMFLENYNLTDMITLTPDMVFDYLRKIKVTRQREVLCELRGIFRYLNRDDLISSIAGIHAPRIKRIIPTLTDEEIDKINIAIKNESVSYRDAAIVITGLSCGIRACDLIRLKLSDIDWNNETISFKQSKTQNQVILPLIHKVGNAIAKYIYIYM